VVLQGAVPGWRATDGAGRERPVGVAGGFLALQDVRPGERFVLTFRPALFDLGAGLGAVGLVALGVLLGLALRDRLTPGRPASPG
jgi:hypothetical protein